MCLISHLADDQMPDTWITDIAEARFNLLMNDLSSVLTWSTFQAVWTLCLYSNCDHVLSFWLRFWSLKMAKGFSYLPSGGNGDTISAAAHHGFITQLFCWFVCSCPRATKVCFSTTLFSFKEFTQESCFLSLHTLLVGCTVLIGTSYISPSHHSLKPVKLMLARFKRFPMLVGSPEERTALVASSREQCSL